MDKFEHLHDRAKGKVKNFLENKLALHWIWVIALWLGSWTVLASLADSCWTLTWIGMGILAFHLTNWMQKGIGQIIPKRLITATHDKAVLITGCDTGFGHHLAVRLDKLGFKVFAGCLFPDGKGAKELRKETSDRLQVLEIDVTCDVTIQKAYKIVRQILEDENLRLWGLVNNAGIANMIEVEWCPLSAYQRIFDVNSLGLIRVTKTFLPLVRKNEGNRIIIVASLAGRYTFPGFTAYSMSKHAAVSFADGLRLEMRKWNISVHTVEPTLYRTPISEPVNFQKQVDKMWEECPEEVKKAYGSDYMEDFKNVLSDQLAKAKPTEKIHEVIDDMVDAVAGDSPQDRYVPSLQTQLRAHFLSSLSKDILDNVLAKGTPQTPPADLEGRNRFTF